ncbi:AAA family ATPase [Micromonospora sp. NPDC049559]|uniref:AAA family ATPase n=1 Tax=Micromonospora sp. NPDC049559 TaxID=3155923 RepID=UPI00341B0879
MRTGGAVGDDVADLRARLRHVHWIGGGSGAGKSTVARRIAERYGLRLYRTDDVMAEHAARSSPERCPSLTAFKAMDMDERWLNRSPEVMLDTFHWYRGEAFDLIVEDLLRLPPGPGVVVEGFRLLPHLVAPLLAAPRRAVWLLPTPEFRRAAFVSRGTLWDIAARTSDPGRALDNLLVRDRMFTERLAGEVRRLGLPGIEVDTATTEAALTGRVATALGLGPDR